MKSISTALLAACLLTAGCAATSPVADPPVPESAAAGSCTDPVLMVVTGTVSDAARMRAYGQALEASGMYPATSGYYLHIGQPIDLFEGEYPAGGFTVIARFPCLAHARAFWYSEAYQNIIPMRDGAGEVLVRVYRELEAPPYMDGRLEGGRFVTFPPVDDIAQR